MTKPQWLAPTGLSLLSVIPIIGGALRMTELTGGAVPTADNARFLDSPIPIVAHIVSVTIYSLLGAFQFVPAFRGRRGWHRIAGRILIPAGFVVALSGLWMAIFYPSAPGYGDVLTAFRVVFASAMLACLVLGVRAIVRRDFVQHGAWMTRAYAIAIAAGTQALVLIPCSIIFGSTHNLAGSLFTGAGWIINLAVAEYIIRKDRHDHHESRRVPPLRSARGRAPRDRAEARAATR
jgi:uncharacterized membrane protein YozB (DUF420 family)